jgi:phosphoribosylaminoimidazolecarboxamide formyltransferase / IMP cyclohydrolase
MLKQREYLMASLQLKYGCNPHQGQASLARPGGSLPVSVLNGQASYINVLDALSAWQLVRELQAATKKVTAASFKHVSPAGAAIDGPITEEFARAQFLDRPPESPVARAYVRARGADRMSSFGDAVAVSDRVTSELADILRREVSDLIIAPAYEPEALKVLSSKRGGSYLILQMDPDFEPGPVESREVFGLTLQQERNSAPITRDVFATEPPLPEGVLETLVTGTAALKYAQSNSVAIAFQGQVIGMGAGQQSRIHCTRLACAKAEKWMLQTHPKVLALRFPSGLGRPAPTSWTSSFSGMSSRLRNSRSSKPP